MQLAIELLGHLVLLLLGLVVPIFGIVLSLSEESRSNLRAEYENWLHELNQSIKRQKNKLASVGNERPEELRAPLSNLQKDIKKWERAHRSLNRRIQYLNPWKQVSHLSVPLLLSFVGVLVLAWAFTDVCLGLYFVLFLVFASLVYAMVAFVRSLGILIDAQKALERDKKEREASLKAISVEDDVLLENMEVQVDGIQLRRDQANKTKWALGEDHSLSVAVLNNEDRIARNVQVRFEFPSGFTVYKWGYFSIFSTENSLGLSIDRDFIQGKTLSKFSPVEIKPLERGVQDVAVLLRGENVKGARFTLQIDVVGKTLVEKLREIQMKELEGH